MSRVITFSRTFPVYHPRAGEPTNFVEKIWEALIQMGEISVSLCCELSRETGIGDYTMNSIRKVNFDPKFTTIRVGHRFKVGDWFSPRVWSGKPYNSKQIIIAPDIQIKKVWNFKMNIGLLTDEHNFFIENTKLFFSLERFAENDGLSKEDFYNWFNKPFEGQVICWNENIEY